MRYTIGRYDARGQLAEVAARAPMVARPQPGDELVVDYEFGR